MSLTGVWGFPKPREPLARRTTLVARESPLSRWRHSRGKLCPASWAEENTGRVLANNGGLGFLMSGKRGSDTVRRSFDWVNWHFRDNDPELSQFNNQLGLTTLGAFTPGQAPTIFNPLLTLNTVPQATLLHERVHQELTRATTFGLFFEVLFALAKEPRFKRIVKVCYQHQWRVQETCATYSGIAVVAQRDPSYLTEAVRRLPSGRANPYREAFDALAEVIPIQRGMSEERLQGQQIFVTAIGHASMNNDCLLRFQSPELLNEQTLLQYLSDSSPNQRFQKILHALRGYTELEAIVERVQQDLSREEVNPIRPAIREIARLSPNVPIVSTFEEIQRQHEVFRLKWESLVAALPSDSQPFGDRNAAGKIPAVQIPEDYGPQPLTIDDVRKSFVTTEIEGNGLWATIYVNEEKLKLDLMPYDKGPDANPSSDTASAYSVLKVGFRSGQFSLQEIVAVFDEFPNLPHAITFISGSWFYWQRGSAGHSAGQRSVQVCFDRGLSLEGLQVMLAFHDLSKTGEFFILQFDENQAVAVIADPKSPGHYVLQYLAGDAGLILFKDNYASTLGIKEMRQYETKVPHIPLLKLMSFPEFLAATRRWSKPDTGAKHKR